MPEVQEVFHMATQKVRPHPGALDRQHREQRRRTVRRKAGVYAIVAALGVAAVGVILGTRGGQDATTPASEPERPANATAVEVAARFTEAYGAFDAEQAITFLADDADLSGVGGLGGTREFRLLISFLEAQGYKQLLDSCEETSSSASGTEVRCTFDFHAIRSDEIGLGPYGGSYFDLTVRDGEIVRASLYWEIGEFSPQMWEPFADWVSKTYPEDAAVMYNEDLTDFRLSEESIGLWERRIREYVAVELADITAPSVPEVDYVIDLNTGVRTPLPEAIIRSLGETDESGQYAASPDGSTLAYVVPGDDETSQIFVAGIDGTGIRQVTHDPVGADWPAWSPDGTRIAYEGGAVDGDRFLRNLFVLDVATGESAQISSAVSTGGGLQFTPDGSSLVYTGGSFPVPELRTVPVAGGESTLLIGPGEGFDSAGNGSLSPDGSLVTFQGSCTPRSGESGPCRWVANADGTERRIIPGYGANPVGTWSPDGGRFLTSLATASPRMRRIARTRRASSSSTSRRETPRNSSP